MVRWWGHARSEHMTMTGPLLSFLHHPTEPGEMQPMLQCTVTAVEGVVGSKILPTTNVVALLIIRARLHVH